MDTSLPSAGEPAPGPSGALAAEIRHSAYLIGGALGLMGSFATLLLFLTTRFGG